MDEGPSEAALVVVEQTGGSPPVDCEQAARVLMPGGHLVCVSMGGDPVAVSPECELETVASIRWFAGDSPLRDAADFAGAANQPCGEIAQGSELLVMKSPGDRSVSSEVASASRLPAALYASCVAPVWLVSGPIRPGIPLALAERIVRFFSFHEDLVQEPFAQSPAVRIAARSHGRRWSNGA